MSDREIRKLKRKIRRELHITAGMLVAYGTILGAVEVVRKVSKRRKSKK